MLSLPLDRLFARRDAGDAGGLGSDQLRRRCTARAHSRWHVTRGVMGKPLSQQDCRRDRQRLPLAAIHHSVCCDSPAYPPHRRNVDRHRGGDPTAVDFGHPLFRPRVGGSATRGRPRMRTRRCSFPIRLAPQTARRPLTPVPAVAGSRSAVVPGRRRRVARQAPSVNDLGFRPGPCGSDEMVVADVFSYKSR